MLRSHAGMILGNWAESLAALDGDDAGAVGEDAHHSVGEGRMSSEATQARFTLSLKLRDALYGKDGLFADLAFDNPKQLGGKNTPDNPFDDTFEGGRPPALSAIEAGAYAGVISMISAKPWLLIITLTPTIRRRVPLGVTMLVAE